MIVAYLEIAQAIKDQVKDIRWIDLDKGQLDNPEAYNSLITPSVLIGMANIHWSQLAGGYQQGEGTLSTKSIFVLPVNTNLIDPLVREHLKRLSLSEDVSSAVLSVPGVISRLTTREYPSGTYYVIEETFKALFHAGPTLTQKTVQVQINPFLNKPSVTP